MMVSRALVVATAVQKAVMQDVLLGEIATGFWKNARPSDHAASWKGVDIRVGVSFGAEGFEIPRNYNFVNPDFFKRVEAKLMESAIKVDPNITTKQLKKQLITLNQILGGRVTEMGGLVAKLPRGRKASAVPVEPKATKGTKPATRKVLANLVDPEDMQESTVGEKTVA